jgi:hypothetical protein
VGRAGDFKTTNLAAPEEAAILPARRWPHKLPAFQDVHSAKAALAERKRCDKLLCLLW